MRLLYEGFSLRCLQLADELCSGNLWFSIRGQTFSAFEQRKCPEIQKLERFAFFLTQTIMVP